MQLLQKESDAKLAYKAEEATLKRRRDKELHQAQLTTLQAPIAPQGFANANRIKLDDKDADKGILSDAACALMPQFVGVACKYVIAIFAKKFKPENLYKLIFSINLDKDNKDFNISFNSNIIKQMKVLEQSFQPNVWRISVHKFTTLVPNLMWVLGFSLGTTLVAQWVMMHIASLKVIFRGRTNLVPKNLYK